jgi:phenylacetate-coenzyme A ligase PaaK-like adenylate-forming protein
MTDSAIDALLAIDPFDHGGAAALFLRAADECLTTLRRRFPRYAAFLDERSGPAARPPLETMGQLDALAPLFLPVLKTYAFDLPPDLRVSVRLSSSGTSGQPSLVPLDDENMRHRVLAMRRSYEALGILTGPTTAVAFLLDPATTRMAGSVVIDAVLRSHADVRSIHYLARLGPTGPTFDAAAAREVMLQAAQAGPVLAVGYPALIAAAIQGLRKAGVSQFPLPPGSLILTGGGWKTFLPGVQLDQQEFRRLAAEFFQVPETAIRDMFGLSECPAVFVQCARGGYHVPAFACAEAIDPETTRPVPEGQIGLLQLTVPLTTSYPLLKILTTDKMVLGGHCPCGLTAPVLKPQGRASAARFETCAMKIGRAVA